jgi:hypothetical protein
MVTNEHTKKEENELQDKQNAYRQQQQEITNTLNAWSEFLKLPSIGPFQVFSQDLKSNITEIYKLNQLVARLQIDLSKYWTQVNSTYLQAVNDASKRAPRKYNSKEDLENYRKIIIDSFEEAFTGLFGSKEFASLHNNILSYELDLLKYLQEKAQSNFKLLNLPTRKEIDEILIDIHDLKKLVREMKTEVTKKDDTENIST